MDSSNVTPLYSMQIPVRWGDMDALGHVNNTVYFRFYEQTRVQWYEEEMGALQADAAIGIVIVSTSCDFLIPVVYPATVKIIMTAGELGRSSLQTYYELFVVGDERLFARGAAKIVWFSTRTGKSVPLPEALRQKLSSNESRNK